MGTVSIIGTGAVGRSLAWALFNAGNAPAEVYSKNGQTAAREGKRIGAKRSGAFTSSSVLSKVVIIAVPDQEIGRIAKDIARRSQSLNNTVFLHTSGALSSDELSPLKRKGASVGSLHPLQTFSAKAGRTEMNGVPCAVEGDRKAVASAKRLIRLMGANMFVIRKKDKVLYHIAAVFASNYLVTLLAVTEQLGKTIGLKERRGRSLFAPLIRKTVENVLTTSPAEALTGPIKRGDGMTVIRHIKTLGSRPSLKELLPLYAALGIETTHVAQRQK